MRREPAQLPRTAALVLVALLGGCSSLGGVSGIDWDEQTRRINPAKRVADPLQAVELLSRSQPEQQAAQVARARADYLNDPGNAHTLLYALLLATPGHDQSNPTRAHQLLGDLLARPRTLSPPEKALIGMVHGDLAEMLALQGRLEAAQAAAQAPAETIILPPAPPPEPDPQRLAALAAENARLKRELAEARAKLEAIAELERALSTRHGGAEPPP